MRLHGFLIFSATVCVALCCAASKADFDVSPRAVANQVVTGAFDDDTQAYAANQRVFDYSFQEDPDDPNFTQDPGFNALANNGLPGTGPNVEYPVGSGQFQGANTGTMFFDILSDLQNWNGANSVAFGAVPAGETLSWALGSQSRTIGTGTGFQTGFALQILANDGSMHKHLGATLNAGSNATPSDGIYMVELQLRESNTNSNINVANSLPFWVIYDNGMSDDITNEAVDWANANLVPEPSTFVLGAIGACAGLLLLRSSKRRELI